MYLACTCVIGLVGRTSRERVRDFFALKKLKVIMFVLHFPHLLSSIMHYYTWILFFYGKRNQAREVWPSKTKEGKIYYNVLHGDNAFYVSCAWSMSVLFFVRKLWVCVLCDCLGIFMFSRASSLKKNIKWDGVHAAVNWVECCLCELVRL